MKIFKSYTFTWWQMGIFKLALLAVGVAIGSYWFNFFETYLTALIVIAIVTGGYTIYISLKQ